MNIKNIGNGVSTTVQSVDTIITNYEKNKINLDAVYQRDIVWDNDKKSKFIESCLKGIIPNPLIFNYENGNYICIDGKQRITSLVEFFENKFPLEYSGIDYYATKAKALDKEIYDNLKNTNIPVYVYKNLTYEEQVDIFHRIQYGQALTAGQVLLSCSNDITLTIEYKNYFTDPIKVMLGKLCNTDPKKSEHYKLVAELIFLMDRSYKKPTKNDIENTYKKIKAITPKLEIVTKLLNFVNNKNFLLKTKVGAKYMFANPHIKYPFLHFLLNTKYNDKNIYDTECFNIVSSITKKIYNQVIDKDQDINKKNDAISLLFSKEFEASKQKSPIKKAGKTD